MSTPGTAVTDSNKLAWLLEDLKVTGVRFAVLLSEDGLRISNTRGITIDDAERFAAAASGLRSLGKALAEFCGGVADNGVRQSMTEYGEGMIFITAAGAGALLGVSTTHDVDVSLIAHRMNELAVRVGHELGSMSRNRADAGRP
ncbi:roadblock/LC7 domain-containing protein [Nocardia yamanashiensis]|uniref:roadblock/LC7 domain-containing protein n=1 Tax=Nocardia yamanashiensis TaxID=209247 RepID=UPI0008352BB7|nr:roadblock/LC7 domain-containing protein [Nocardia yamanashiensis]UGT43681.1 roadblock/LC7 domain-containing protein [Nocardia yamanashiensis]